MNPESNRRIGEFIRTSRLKRGLPEPQVAQAVGYRHGGTIRRIESGALAFPLARADQFADALGMDRGEFWEKLGRLRMAGTLPDHTPSPSAPTPLPRSLVKRLERMKRTGELWRKMKAQAPVRD